MFINQTPGNATNSMASGLFAAINNASAQSQSPAKTGPDSAPGTNPATQINLSPEAQQRLANDKAAADKLASAVAGNTSAAPEDRSKDLSFDSLFDMADAANPVREQSEDGVLKAIPADQRRTTDAERNKANDHPWRDSKTGETHQHGDEGGRKRLPEDEVVVIGAERHPEAEDDAERGDEAKRKVGGEAALHAVVHDCAPIRFWVRRSIPPMRVTSTLPRTAPISSADQICTVWP